MSNIALILGESGSGKSTSIRTLKEDETFIINVLDKPLPFKGYRKRYSKQLKNYHATDDYKEIIAYIRAINERRPEIRNIVLDDFNFVMANEFMMRASEKSFERFVDIGKHTFEVVEELKALREDLYVFIMSHTELNHAGIIKTKTVGKMVDDKVGIEARISVVFHAKVIDGQFKFLTQFDGLHMAKTPMQMFELMYIDNDLQYVREKMIEYFEETEE